MLRKIFSIFNKRKVPENLRPYHSYQELLSNDYLQNLIKYGDFIDAREGGFLLGNSHNDGGIIFLFEYADGFRVFGEVEGHEYIINRDSAEIHRARIGEINNHTRDYNYFEEYEVPKNIKIIDARGGFSIINRHSTRIHLNEIDEINKSN